MKLTSLLSPGMLSNANRLRIEAATALSRAQLSSMSSPTGKSKAAKDLQNFFTDCASRLATYVESTAPTVLSRVRTSATVVTVTFSETLAAGEKNTPSASAFTVSGATVVSVAVSGSTVVLTGTGFLVGQTVAYTAPAKSPLIDLVGNPVANFSGVTA